MYMVTKAIEINYETKFIFSVILFIPFMISRRTSNLLSSKSLFPKIVISILIVTQHVILIKYYITIKVHYNIKISSLQEMMHEIS